MAEALKDNVKSREEPRIYEAKPAALLDLIRATPDDVRSLLIVGHNPTLQALALELVGSGDVEARRRLAEKLPTAALVVIDFAGNGWSEVHRQGGRLDRFVTPATLVAIPD
jgi:phosphohistidine phosphatase